MREPPTTEQIRSVAIDHHSKVVGGFEDNYAALARDRFSSAFTYGRYKIDIALDGEVGRLSLGARILDIGCGTGEYVKRYRAQGFVVSAIEPAAGMRASAIAANPGVVIEDAVSTSLPFQDGAFDFAFAVEVYRYLHRDDVRQSFKELLRVLRPGGRFFITMVNRWALDGFYVHQKMRQALRGGRADTTHPHCEFFTPGELVRELRAAGADDVRTCGRMLAPLRIAYKVPGLGSWLAKAVERTDDSLHRSGFATAVAGHLIATGRHP